MHIPQTEIILRHDGTELARVTLPPGEYVIGRARESDIHAETPLISRRHALLTINYDHLLIEDLGSSKGTFVNGQPVVEPTRLFPNQSIRLGPDIAIEVRRQRVPSDPHLTLTPTQSAIRRHLPDELLAEKRYAIGSVVAQGGMGAILDARQRAIDRTVAMKVMLKSADEVGVLRFIDEAKITGQLDHPNIVPIYELGVDEQGQVFYTMKFVRGTTLKTVLAQLAAGDAATVEKYPLPVLLTVFQKVCDAIAFAHNKGVIHRDLKPENLMLGDFGSVLVMDWGLAKITGQNDAPGRDVRRSGIVTVRAAEPEISATMTGSIMGTPAYMSPEQARGEVESLDARSDIYALGAILFEMLHRRPAVTGSAAMEIAEKVQRGEVAWNVTQAGKPVPLSLLAVVRKAMAFEKTARYADVAALQADLTAYQNGFVTSAEEKTAWKQFKLLIKRNKAASIGLAAVLLVSAAFTAKVIAEGRRAERALADLRGTAPTFAEQARTLMQAQQFEPALEKANYAVTLAPKDANYHLLRGHILAALARVPEASDAYRTALALVPGDPIAAANARLCAQLDPGDIGVRMRLQAAAQAEGRTAESAFLLRQIGKGSAAFQDLVQRLKAQALPEDWASLREDGGLRLYLDDSFKGENLDWLRGVPLTELSVGRNQIPIALNDLSALRGMPLRIVALNGTAVRDLSPLSDLPLESLELTSCPIEDLSPLTRSKLKRLVMGGLPIRDLRALRGLPLEDLWINGLAQITDITPLADMKLRFLRLEYTHVDDLSPLHGMPLESLSLAANGFTSLRPLEGMPLQVLLLNRCNRFTDLSPLSGMKLRRLNLTGTAVKDFSPLAGMPLEKLALNAHATELTWLRGAPLRALNLGECRSQRSAEPLLDFPTLEVVLLPRTIDDLAPLEKLPKLARAAFEGVDINLSGDELDLRRLPPLQVFLAESKDRNSPAYRLWKMGAIATKLEDGTYEVKCARQNTTDLAPLAGAPISRLYLDGNPLTDLSPLKGLPLQELALRNSQAADLSPLRGMSLKALHLFGSQVANLEPLRGMPLENLYFDGTPVTDLRPLLDMPKLRQVMIPRTATNIEILRPLTNLEYIGWELDWQGEADTGRPGLTSAEFWARFDAQQAAEK